MSHRKNDIKRIRRPGAIFHEHRRRRRHGREGGGSAASRLCCSMCATTLGSMVQAGKGSLSSAGAGHRLRAHAPQVFVKCILRAARQRFFAGIARMAQKRAEVLTFEVVEDCRLGATRLVLRAREAERRPRPRGRIAATRLRLASHQHGRASWRGLGQPWIVSRRLQVTRCGG